MLRTHRFWLALVAIVAALSFAIVTADARPSGSMGSRGSRTFSTPAPTATAPKGIAPIERSATQPSARPAPSTVGQAGRPGGLFGGGLLGGLAAGFLGAGLFGMLFGHGFMSGLGSFASVLGLLLQVGIVVLVARLAWSWWQRRNQPSYAGATPMRSSLFGGGQGPGGFGGFPGLGGGGGASASNEAPLQVKPEDFDAFERLLGEVLTAYGAEDMNALRARATPEMLAYFTEELEGNAKRGDINQMSDIKLLQGDLSEAWREGQDEYATVAMRFSLKDRFVERTGGKLVKEMPSEATELWTFLRNAGGEWKLAAIQQSDNQQAR